MNEQLTTTPGETPSPTDGAKRVARLRRFRLGGIIALALAGGIVAWVVADHSGSSEQGRPSVAPIAPIALSASGLATLSHAVRQPIYWAGPRNGYRYELHRTADGSVYIRYLPRGAEVGAPGAKFLTVATYPFAGAFEALKNVKDGRQISIPGGGIALIGSTYKKAIHIAYPNVDYQVEVYDPSAARAFEVVTSGKIRPA
jgi:hypothetical protein